MENNKKEKQCEICKYFLQHYIKDDKGRFLKIFVGHCINQNLTFKQSDKIIEEHRSCDYWEPVSIKIEERKKSIFENIDRMEKHLSQIAQILKDDFENSINS